MKRGVGIEWVLQELTGDGSDDDDDDEMNYEVEERDTRRGEIGREYLIDMHI